MNIYKFVVVVCLIFFAGASYAQTPTATVKNGLIQVNQALGWQDEYVIDISGLGLQNLQSANSYFEKYITTFGSYASFLYDFSKNVCYMRVERQSASVTLLTPASLNNVLRIIYTR